MAQMPQLLLSSLLDFCRAADLVTPTPLRFIRRFSSLVSIRVDPMYAFVLAPGVRERKDSFIPLASEVEVGALPASETLHQENSPGLGSVFGCWAPKLTTTISHSYPPDFSSFL